MRTTLWVSVSILVPCGMSLVSCAQCCSNRRQYLRLGKYVLFGILIESNIPSSSSMLNLKVLCPFMAKPPCIPCTDWYVLRMRLSNCSGWVAILMESNELIPIRKKLVPKHIVGRSLDCPLMDWYAMHRSMWERLKNGWSAWHGKQVCRQWLPKRGEVSECSEGSFALCLCPAHLQKGYCRDLFLAVFAGKKVNRKLKMMPHLKLEELKGCVLNERHTPCKNNGYKGEEDISKALLSSFNRCLGHEQQPIGCPPCWCQSRESFISHVAVHFGNEVGPLGVADHGGNGMSCNLIASFILLFCMLLTQVTVRHPAISPSYVVLAPIVGAVIVLLLVCLSVLGRHPLPLPILLLITFVGSVLLVIFLALAPSFLPPFFSPSSFLPAACLSLGVRTIDLLGHEFGLHCNDLLFFKQFCAPYPQ